MEERKDRRFSDARSGTRAKKPAQPKIEGEFEMIRFGGENTRRAVRRVLLMSASSLAATAVFASLASAQDTAGSDDGLAEVVVTAQMREQNVQDIPLSITAVTGDLLEARSQTNLREISAQAPNVLLQQNPSGSGNSMRAFIRGVGQSDQSPSVEPGVGIYVDDIYFGTVTASAFDLVDLDRVEILRGPQGTLSGTPTSYSRASPAWLAIATVM
jgi:iron complex outermembrane recepter protein